MNATTARIDLSTAAYTSKNFDRVFNTFRARFPEGFQFGISAPWQNPGKDCMVVTTLERDEAFAAEIVAALEAAV